MAFPPKAFIIGAQKAGTTFLSYLLDQHPHITLAESKEPDFFTRHREKGLEWYRKSFSGPEENILIDASTSYTAAGLPEYDGIDHPYFSGVPKRLHSLVPDARLIYLVRDPVARTYSSYWHNVLGGTERRAFKDALMNDSFYLRLSSYAQQLSLYLQYFPQSAFLILLFEDLKADPIGTAQKCFRFLGVQENADLEVDTVRNKSFLWRGWVSLIDNTLLNYGGVNGLIKAVKPLIPVSAQKRLAKLITQDIPPMDDKDREFLIDHFKDKNKELEKLFGLSLNKWQ